jgi:hypothetical protein
MFQPTVDEIVSIMANSGVYLASKSTLYYMLHEQHTKLTVESSCGCDSVPDVEQGYQCAAGSGVREERRPLAIGRKYRQGHYASAA